MDRPNDIHGNEVKQSLPGRFAWYWGRYRNSKQVAGVGCFACTASGDHWTWFLNGTSYDPTLFDFAKAEEPGYVFGETCEHGVNPDKFCETCYRESCAESERSER